MLYYPKRQVVGARPTGYTSAVGIAVEPEALPCVHARKGRPLRGRRSIMAAVRIDFVVVAIVFVVVVVVVVIAWSHH
jgi:hypothetical protein